MRPTRCFATALPGLGAVLAEELTASGATTAPAEGDGRNDVVPCTGDPHALLRLRCSEDVLASVASTALQRTANATAAALVDTPALDAAVAVRAATGPPLRGPVTVRAVVRLRTEDRFRRSELRDALDRALLRTHRRWRFADPAQVELWVTESRPGVLRAGIRLSGAAMRHRGGRAAERAGALRPTAAAAMVRLAGAPSGVLADPCCGSGTVLAEARAAGWTACGGDTDPGALDAARRNAGGALLWRGDATRPPLRDGSVAAVVSNLPWGGRFAATHDGAVVAAIARALAPGAPAVLLHAPGSGSGAAAAARRAGLREERRLEVVVLGRRAVLTVHRAAR